MERWEVETMINSHPVIQQLQSRMHDLNDVLHFTRPNQNMLMEIRSEIGYDTIKEWNKPHPNGDIYARLRILETRMNIVDSKLSTIEKAIIHLCHQLGYVKTLRVPDPTPIEERLDENA